ncbi:ttn-1 [Symbiodinium necroappetens]|uniref:Ttn-1 protein n=1 Tax=Symbiodinium necroappetens TaxID=1628268 RepID=A0A812KR77_9DINO|nr:ttn-1 [Symbiodinium necroappetens]
MSTEEEGSEEDEQQEARQSKESGKVPKAKAQTATVDQFFKKKPKEEATKEAEKPAKAKKDKAKEEEEEEEAKPKKAKKNEAKEEEEEAKPKKAQKDEAAKEEKPKKAKKDKAKEEEEAKPKKAKKDEAKEEEEAKPTKAKKDKAKEGEEAKLKKTKKNEAEEEEEAKPKKAKKDKAKEQEEAKLKKAKKNEAKEEEEAKPKEEKSGSKRKGEGSAKVAKKRKGNAPQLAIEDQEERSKQPEEKSKAKATKDAGEGKSDAKSANKTKKKEKGAKQKKKLAKAEKKLETINSSTHHTEYLRYKRWIKNRKRFPQALVGRIETEDGRANLFRDYIEAGGKVEQILLKHEQMLCEQQRTIIDPESPEDKLYFVFVEINIDDIRELKRITKLELSGGVDSETLAAFTKAGGVLDPKAQLASADGKGSQAAMNKALELSQLNKGTGSKQNNRKKNKDKGKEDAKEVKPNEPIEDAKALQHVVLKDCNTCRENAFKLAPLRMSGPLISQLKAVEVSLTAKATILQKLIAKKKNKKKHYKQVTGEVQELQKLAKERVDLAKALIRASAKSSKPASPGKGKEATKRGLFKGGMRNARKFRWEKLNFRFVWRSLVVMFVSGWRFAFSGCKGDWEAKVYIHKLQRGDVTLSDLQKKLQTDVWKHYKAWCRENAVAACGHRFSLIRFGKEAWNHAPELASCYKAYTVKQMIYWAHAYLVDTMPQSRHDLTCASYSMAKMQFNMDISGPFFQEDLKKDTVLMGRSFLVFYQRLAVQNANSARKNFKIIPKHHSFLHLMFYVDRTARNPRRFGSDFADISDWYEHCYQDEDLMKEIGRICSSCHPATMHYVTCNRYRALLEYGEVFERKTG